jgi:DNA-binding response OmpR family regulator
MKKIAVIEDDPDLFALLKYNLEKDGFQFVGATKGGGALDLCTRERPDLLLLDIMLPDSDGLEICKLLRRTPQLAHLPIIFLTAKAAETDRIVGLELGANDYIVKPFFMRELLTRVRVQLRSRADVSLPLKSGALELDRNQCRVWLDGREIALTATEFRLLEFLMSRRGAVYTRGQLLDSVWGHDRVVTERTVDVYVLRLRQKLEEDPEHPKLIRSVRGFGYSFQEETVRNGAA